MDERVSALADELTPGTVVTDPDVIGELSLRPLQCRACRDSPCSGQGRDHRGRSRDPEVGVGAPGPRRASGSRNRPRRRVACDRRLHNRCRPSGCARSTIDPLASVAVAQPGALNVEVKQAAAEYGLWYPPDPSSFEICSIGGNVATNAGGLCCVKYGVTTDHVLGHRGRARRRPRHTSRRTGDQRRDRLRLETPVHRQRGHPRNRDRSDTAASPRSASVVRPWSPRSATSKPPDAQSLR